MTQEFASPIWNDIHGPPEMAGEGLQHREKVIVKKESFSIDNWVGLESGISYPC